MIFLSRLDLATSTKAFDISTGSLIDCSNCDVEPKAVGYYEECAKKVLALYVDNGLLVVQSGVLRLNLSVCDVHVASIGMRRLLSARSREGTQIEWEFEVSDKWFSQSVGVPTEPADEILPLLIERLAASSERAAIFRDYHTPA